MEVAMKFSEEVFAVGGGNWDPCLNQPAKPRGPDGPHRSVRSQE